MPLKCRQWPAQRDAIRPLMGRDADMPLKYRQWPEQWGHHPAADRPWCRYAAKMPTAARYIYADWVLTSENFWYFNLVRKLSRKLLPWHMAAWLGMMSTDDLNNFWKKKKKKSDFFSWVMALWQFRHFNLVSNISWKLLKLLPWKLTGW